jgi:hypothetical protein
MITFGTAILGKKKVLGGLAIVAIAVVTLILFCFSPERYPFYPRCLFHALTGLDCPGCGGLRAAHRLLHGDVAGAFAFNPMLIVLSPVLGWFLLGWIVRERTGRTWPNPFRRRVWIWVLLGGMIVFSIVRNLPFAR